MYQEEEKPNQGSKSARVCGHTREDVLLEAPPQRTATSLTADGRKISLRPCLRSSSVQMIVRQTCACMAGKLSNAGFSHAERKAPSVRPPAR